MTIVHFPQTMSQLSRAKFPGFFFEATGIKYFARRTADASNVSRHANDFTQLPNALPLHKVSGPSTFLQLSVPTVTREWLSNKIDRFSQVDDVFNSSFLQNLVFVQRETNLPPSLDPSVKELIASLGASISFVSSDLTPQSEGPYYLSTGVVHRVWRLYPDTSESFVTAIIRCAEDDAKYACEGFSTGHKC